VHCLALPCLALDSIPVASGPGTMHASWQGVVLCCVSFRFVALWSVTECYSFCVVRSTTSFGAVVGNKGRTIAVHYTVLYCIVLYCIKVDSIPFYAIPFHSFGSNAQGFGGSDSSAICFISLAARWIASHRIASHQTPFERSARTVEYDTTFSVSKVLPCAVALGECDCMRLYAILLDSIEGVCMFCCFCVVFVLCCVVLGLRLLVLVLVLASAQS